ncbi:MAG: glycosyltransferase family protein [Janthinobacterium lividum]
MIFVKTGADPEQRRAAWSLMPPRWRTVMEDAAAAALARPTGDITDLVVDAAEAHDLVPEQRTELLFSLMTEVDLYVRDTRSTAMTRALLDLPVDIYGRGWDHVSAEATRARFHPAFDADGLPRMYAETQFMLNTSPNFSSGVHERVAYAMDARCCVVSDENDFMKREFEAIPTFFAVDPRDPDLRDRLHEIYHDRTDYTPLTQPALDLTERMFSGERYMLSLLELAHEVRMTAKLVEYRA